MHTAVQCSVFSSPCRDMFVDTISKVQAGISKAGGAGVPSMQERQALFKEDP